MLDQWEILEVKECEVISLIIVLQMVLVSIVGCLIPNKEGLFHERFKSSSIE